MECPSNCKLPRNIVIGWSVGLLRTCTMCIIAWRFTFIHGRVYAWLLLRGHCAQVSLLSWCEPAGSAAQLHHSGTATQQVHARQMWVHNQYLASQHLHLCSALSAGTSHTGRRAPRATLARACLSALVFQFRIVHARVCCGRVCTGACSHVITRYRSGGTRGRGRSRQVTRLFSCTQRALCNVPRLDAMCKARKAKLCVRRGKPGVASYQMKRLLHGGIPLNCPRSETWPSSK